MNAMRAMRLRDLGVAELVRQVAGGDKPSWDELVERFTPIVWSIARSMGASAADVSDVAQTTWLRLLEHIDDVEHPERIGGWLATTARRECIRVQQRASRLVPVGDDQELDRPAMPAPPADVRVLVDERDAALWRAFGTLPERGRMLLGLLSADPPLSYREISDVMEIPIGSIGPTRARLLETLRKRAEREGIVGESRAV